jgi:ribosomal protein L9
MASHIGGFVKYFLIPTNKATPTKKMNTYTIKELNSGIGKYNKESNVKIHEII